MIQLGDLTESGIMHNVQMRYDNKLIYVSTHMHALCYMCIVEILFQQNLLTFFVESLMGKQFTIIYQLCVFLRIFLCASHCFTFPFYRRTQVLSWQPSILIRCCLYMIRHTSTSSPTRGLERNHLTSLQQQIMLTISWSESSVINVLLSRKFQIDINQYQ